MEKPIVRRRVKFYLISARELIFMDKTSFTHYEIIEWHMLFHRIVYRIERIMARNNSNQLTSRTGVDVEEPSNEGRQPYASDIDNEVLLGDVRERWVATWLRWDFFEIYHHVRLSWIKCIYMALMWIYKVFHFHLYYYGSSFKCLSYLLGITSCNSLTNGCSSVASSGDSGSLHSFSMIVSFII